MRDCIWYVETWQAMLIAILTYYSSGPKTAAFIMNQSPRENGQRTPVPGIHKDLIFKVVGSSISYFVVCYI